MVRKDFTRRFGRMIHIPQPQGSGEMIFSLIPSGHKQNDQIGIQMLTSKSVMETDVEELNYEPANLVSQSGEEICFEIDHALPVNARIAVKTRREPADPDAIDQIYEVNRGSVRSCVEIEGSNGPRYAVRIQVFETVLQTEIVASRFSRH